MSRSVTKAHVETAAMLYGPAENVATTRNGERWPTPKEEAWIARQLGRPDLFAGVTTAEERRERVAKRIGEIGPDEVWREGRTESWAEVFRRAYGIALAGERDYHARCAARTAPSAGGRSLMLRVDPVERYETHCGCLVETQRHAYSDGTTIEHVTLSTPDPDHQPTEGDDHDDSDCP